MKKRFGLFSMLLLIAAVALSACSSSDNSLDRVKKAGKLVIAIDATYPPMEYMDEDGRTPIGFDVDLGRAVAEKLGVEADFAVVPWDGILTGLGARYDVIISSMNITEERLKTANFVEYARMSQVFVTKGDIEVKTPEDLAGLRVAVQQDTTSFDWVEEIQDSITLQSVVAFPGATDAFLELQNGRADVIVIDEPVGLYYVNLDPSSYKVTGQAVEPEPIGMAVAKKDESLYQALEKAFAEVKADGTYKQLTDKWFGRELGQ